MKRLNVTMVCKAYYKSSIELPREDMTLDEAIDYARQNMDDISCGELEWESDIGLDEDNCDFAAEE